MGRPRLGCKRNKHKPTLRHCDQTKARSTSLPIVDFPSISAITSGKMSAVTKIVCVFICAASRQSTAKDLQHLICGAKTKTGDMCKELRCIMEDARRMAGFRRGLEPREARRSAPHAPKLSLSANGIKLVPMEKRVGARSRPKAAPPSSTLIRANRSAKNSAPKSARA